MIGWRDSVVGARGAQVERFFTDAVGERQGPYGGFNLGAHVGDDAAVVAGHRARLERELGLPPGRLVWMNQVHGARVEVVAAPWRADPPGVDGVVTTATDLALAVLVADCTPVLLAAPDEGVVAAVHAGRPGMEAAVVPATVARMREQGARRIVAVVGPSVCSRCYEVPEEMRSRAGADWPAAHAVSWRGTPAIDVAGAVVSQLTSEGVEVEWLPGCTRERDDLYSYRRSQVTGRFAGVVVLRAGR